MGCLWSSEATDYCKHCNRRAVNNLVIIDHTCQICITKVTRHCNQEPQPGSGRGPLFGEYRCSGCRRIWTSVWSWPNKRQTCSRCKQPTFPFNQRELLPSDKQDKKDGEVHQKELCEMCQQLGYFCGKFASGKTFCKPKKKPQSRSNKYY